MINSLFRSKVSRMSGPNSEELAELVEKQDDLIENLQSQLEMCKTEVMGLIANCTEKEQKLREAKDVETDLRKQIEELRSSNNMENKESEDAIGKDLNSLVELRLRCRELEFELERETRLSNSRQIQFVTEKNNMEQAISDLEAELQLLRKSEDQISSKLEFSMRKVAEWKTKYDILSAKKEEEIMRLESRIEIATQKEAQLEQHIGKLGEDLSETRQEKMVSMARVSALVEETTTLRAKILRLSTKMPPATIDERNDPKEVQKLLNDQSHLIAALREETKLLARKLEQDARQFRQTIKQLKMEKRELEQRLQNILSV